MCARAHVNECVRLTQWCPMQRTTLVTVRETYLAMMIVSIFLELIGIAFTYALIVWDY